MTDTTETLVEKPDASTLDVSRWLPAPPELLFRLWSQPEHLARWFGPPGFNPKEVNVDLRVGGSWRIAMVSPDGTPHTIGGVYEEISPPSQLVFTWVWQEASAAPGHETRVTLSLAADGEGTLLRLLHQNLTPDQRDGHGRGWMGTLESLAIHLSTL